MKNKNLSLCNKIIFIQIRVHEDRRKTIIIKNKNSISYYKNSKKIPKIFLFNLQFELKIK
jgi:hypothetical protein